MGRIFVIRTLVLVFFSIFFCISVLAQRQMKSINDGWLFIKENIAGAEQTGLDVQHWSRISVPHTWNNDAYAVKDYYRGVAWYRKSLFIPNSEKDRQIFVRFEGVNHSSSLFINGKYVGQHKGGYTAFTFDITPFCKIGEENILAVKVDNTLNDVPPVSGDFTIFGGIYRDVWLISTKRQHIDLLDMGSDGIHIKTDNVSDNSGSYSLKGSLVNESQSNLSVKVVNTIKDVSGNTINVLSQTLKLEGEGKKNFNLKGTVDKPLLWSPENPNLYLVETKIINSKTNEVLDKVDSYIGFRWFSFDGEKGFFLNGKPYKLRGVCRHQDQMPLGNALSDEMHRRDMFLIKDMGANFVRISHYPQDPAILEQCDRLGLLVWEEIPIIDIVPNSDEFFAVSESMLREMIRQHYNHPSVIMWGYMNEILLVTQRKYKGEELSMAVKRALDLAKRLEVVLKEEDDTRCSVMAFHGSESYNDLGFGDITDIVGWNLYQGWYSNSFGDFDKFMGKQQNLYPHKPKIISEYGAGSDKRIHALNPKRFDFSIEYHQQYAEHYLKTIEREPYIAGSAYWNFIDFGSAQRDESMPRINNKGLVYADRTPKDVYYLFKAYYRADIPVLHIASRDWTERISNDLQPLKIYSNLQEVELFVDGQSQGVQTVADKKAEWMLGLAAGEHFISAKGTFNNEIVEDGFLIKIEDRPSILDLQNNELAVNVGSDTYYRSQDSQQTWVPDKEYSENSWGYIGGTSHSSLAQVKGTSDNPLFQTMRVSLDSYRFDVSNGKYEIEILLADVFQPQNTVAHLLASDLSSDTSLNVFDICINDVIVEEDFSLAKTTDYNYATRKKYIVNVLNGCVNIKLITKSGKSFLNALKIRKL